jgi:hypothetical protein
MPHGCRAPLHDGMRVRERTARVAVGDHDGLCRARATSNQAFVNVIIARKRAPSHRVFVAQVFGRNMCGKRRRRHRFSAFWLTGILVYLRLIPGIYDFDIWSVKWFPRRRSSCVPVPLGCEVFGLWSWLLLSSGAGDLLAFGCLWSRVPGVSPWSLCGWTSRVVWTLQLVPKLGPAVGNIVYSSFFVYIYCVCACASCAPQVLGDYHAHI